ncbi:hypothetical protein SBA5_160018 [Candidatus Sulfotelmatomonas gaucii]|uniref:Uncharacterized protein n=1 Tax=Candidatus Sulfuritelmatomonas gaucii TaxID=2043161 RepID=A0A2N9L676_9BACT|nr:hypothetical protein SBA5_160018 [Candidatus Sulfotelmatomonas gaucii]
MELRRSALQFLEQALEASAIESISKRAAQRIFPEAARRQPQTIIGFLSPKEELWQARQVRFGQVR